MPRRLGVGADPLNAQGYRTQRNELPEDLWQPLYDRVHYPAAGSSELSFFSTPRGQSATLIVAGAAGAKVKSYRDTNNENANVIPTKMFKIVGVSLAYIHVISGVITDVNDRAAVREGSYLEFRIVDKDIIHLPVVAIPELNPIVAVATTATTSTMYSSVGGGGQNVPMYKFPIPITINPYENFTVSMKLDGTVTTTSALDVVLILHAFMRRPT
jgi:hypothetical protein